MDWNEVISPIGEGLLALAAVLAWYAFWLWAVNWQKAWKVLGQGGWVPLVLLIVVGTAAWSQVVQTRYSFLGGVSVPSFVWQLCVVLLFVGLALFCGWLQGYFGIQTIEVELEPPPVAHGHDHGHGQH
jgi:uncharacterized YccA/Bax inhibitor family protein